MKGVIAMQQSWKDRNRNLCLFVSEWPKQMSKKEFRTRVQELIDSPDNLRHKARKPYSADSLINRLKNNGFVRFSADSKKWLNLCAKD